ncbi:PREDICTED: uncharacterized protein LOC108776425 [Cyphomyrmex costatus]|uniref:uncharacterized protein LOC108776425 n=1 Tax=Cyphomyrmex costatus TaxID=456900 RepID=UPI0008522B5F|nr:PREDICTED: uncharacterized protein LOC108776425 [Cyphomyrmex costatus]
MKARIAVKGFVAEGSAYETEKETGRGKRKKVQKKLFSDSDSDEDITKHNKKSIPLPPSVPFKCKQVKENKLKKAERELSSMVSSSPLKVLKNNVKKLKTQKINNDKTDSYTMSIAQKSDFSENSRPSCSNKLQSPKKTTIEKRYIFY